MKRIVLWLHAMALAACLPLGLARAQAPEAATPPTGKLITLSVKDTPLRSAMTQLGSQAGLQFNLLYRAGVAEDPLVSIDLQNKPLWSSLQALLNLAGSPPPTLQFSESAGGATYRLSGPFCASGPFLVVARGLTHRIDYTQPDDPGKGVETFQFDVLVFTDPTLRILNIAGFSVPAKALDDKDNSFVPTQAPPDVRTQAVGTSSIAAVTAVINLQYPAGKQIGGKLATIEGVLPASIAMPVAIEVPVGPPVERHLDGMTVSIDFADAQPGAAPTAAGPTVTVTLTREGPTPPGTLQPDDLFAGRNRTQVRLVDANGNAWRTGGSSGRNSASTRTTTYRFQPSGGGTPAKIIVEVPASPRPYNIPYHFENITLP